MRSNQPRRWYGDHSAAPLRTLTRNFKASNGAFVLDPARAPNWALSSDTDCFRGPSERAGDVNSRNISHGTTGHTSQESGPGAWRARGWLDTTVRIANERRELMSSSAARVAAARGMADRRAARGDRDER